MCFRVTLRETRRCHRVREPNGAHNSFRSHDLVATCHASLDPADVVDDETREQVRFLSEDPRTLGTGDEYNQIVIVSIILIVVWTVLVPLFFWRLLRLSNRPGWHALLSDSVGFLYTEYRKELYWWELVELLRKILLAGYMFLMDAKLMRNIVSLLLTIGHLGLLIQAKPYRCSATSHSLTCRVGPRPP